MNDNVKSYDFPVIGCDDFICHSYDASRASETLRNQIISFTYTACQPTKLFLENFVHNAVTHKSE